MSLKVSYDQEQDILYLAREGEEAEALELGTGITLECDAIGALLGAEVLRASQVLREVLKLLASIDWPVWCSRPDGGFGPSSPLG
jgi:uncharacterized protein YuzE